MPVDADNPLVRLLRSERDVGRMRRRPRRMPPQRFPRRTQREYARRLESLVDRFEDMLGERMEELGDLADEAARAREDAVRADASGGRRAREIINEVWARFGRQVDIETEAQTIAGDIAEQVEREDRRMLRRQLERGLGVSAEAVDGLLSTGRIMEFVDGFVAENTDLITNVPQRVKDDVSQATTRAMQDGLTRRELSAEIRERVGMGRNRARLIARDQTGKLKGQLNRARQKSLGIDEYRRRTASDERVRESHDELDGQVFSWDDPPAVGHPGEDYQCRCGADPVMDEIIAVAKQLEAEAA